MTREEAIEILEANRPDPCYQMLREAVDFAVDALKAQIDKDINVPNTDCIYRQAALDALEWTWAGKAAFDAIKNLPSAQPEIIRCKDCKHGVDYYHEGDCYCSNPKWGLTYFGGSWEFYCADAERRTDGKDRD